MELLKRLSKGSPPLSADMYRLGLTGGLGSGKSTAARFFAERGAVVFDADQEAKKLLQTSLSLQKKLIDIFGSRITDSAGNLDFGQLALTAFASEKDQQTLNQLIWPEVYLLIEKADREALSGDTKLFVVDAALLIEAQFLKLFQTILLITADREVRIKRALQRGNLSRDQIEKRMQLQWTDSEKKKFAHHTISNNGTVDEFYDALNLFYASLT